MMPVVVQQCAAAVCSSTRVYVHMACVCVGVGVGARARVCVCVSALLHCVFIV